MGLIAVIIIIAKPPNIHRGPQDLSHVRKARTEAPAALHTGRAPGGDGAACAGPRGAAPSRSSIELFAADRLLWADR